MRDRPEDWKAGTYRDRIYRMSGYECDRCHTAGLGTMYGVDGDEEGSWLYCGPCASLVAAQVDRKAKQQAMRESGERFASRIERRS